MTDAVSLRVRFTLRWWVRPLVRAALIAALLRVPVDIDRLGQLIATHGARYRVESHAPDGASETAHG